MTHSELVFLSAKWLQDNQRCPVVLLEPKVVTGEIPDVVGFFDGGDCIIIECKTSRTDLKIDQTKPYRLHESNGMGDYRYYSLDDGVFRNADEIPEKWGIIKWNGCFFEVIRDSKKFANSHKESEISTLVTAIRTSGIMKNKNNKLSFYGGYRKYPKYCYPDLEAKYEFFLNEKLKKEENCKREAEERLKILKEKERQEEGDRLDFIDNYNRDFPSDDGKFHDVFIIG